MLAVLFIMTILPGNAQGSSKVQKIVKEIVQKYKDMLKIRYVIMLLLPASSTIVLKAQDDLLMLGLRA